MRNKKKDGTHEWDWQSARPKGYTRWRESFRRDAGVEMVLSQLTDTNREDMMRLLYAGPRLSVDCPPLVVKNRDMRKLADNLAGADASLRETISRLEQYPCSPARKARMLGPLKTSLAQIEAQQRFLAHRLPTFRLIDWVIAALAHQLSVAKSRKVNAEIALLLSAAEIPNEREPNEREPSPTWEPEAVKKRLQRFFAHPWVVREK